MRKVIINNPFWSNRHMSQQQQRPGPVLNIFSVMSNWLYADPVDGNKKRPNIRFAVFGNVPRISVRTNVEGDINHGRIDFNTDLATFSAAMAYALKLAEGADVPQERKFIYQDNFVAGKRLDKVITISSLVIGRDPQTGRIYMAVLSSQTQRPRIRFFFGPSQYHTIQNGDGSTITPKEMSEAYCVGFLKPAYDLTLQVLMQQFDENGKNVANPANFAGGGNNQGGNTGGYQGNNNYNRPNNNGGGNNWKPQKPEASGFDDDLPEF